MMFSTQGKVLSVRVDQGRVRRVLGAGLLGALRAKLPGAWVFHWPSKDHSQGGWQTRIADRLGQDSLGLDRAAFMFYIQSSVETHLITVLNTLTWSRGR